MQHVPFHGVPMLYAARTQIPPTHNHHLHTTTTYTQPPPTRNHHLHTTTIYTQPPPTHNHHLHATTTYTQPPPTHSHVQVSISPSRSSTAISPTQGGPTVPFDHLPTRNPTHLDPSPLEGINPHHPRPAKNGVRGRLSQGCRGVGRGGEGRVVRKIYPSTSSTR